MKRGLKLLVLLGLFTPSARGDGQTGTRAPAESRIIGEEQGLSLVSAIAVSSRGVLAVAQPQDGQIRLFDARGRPLARVGRRGEGPGEFRAPRPIGWLADTLWVADYQVFRLTWIDAQGTVLRSAPLPASLGTARVPALDESFTPRVQGVRADGHLLLSVRKRGAAIPGMASDVKYVEEYYVLAEPGGQALRVVSHAPRDDCHRRAPTADLVLPHCPRPLNGVAGDGSRVAHVTSRMVGNGRGEYRLRIVTTAGGLPVVHRREVRLRPISRAVRDTTLAILGRERSPLLRSLARGYEVPSHHPAVRSLAISSHGDVWVGLWSQEGREVREWHVYPADGGAQRTVFLPVDASPYAPGRGGIWVAERDEDGSEDLVFYRG